MKRTLAMLLAGGQGSRLGILSSKRAKPAVPFAGSYRIIDFTLSNCMNSYVPHVGILTQYKPVSLIEHIGTGQPWGYVGRRRLLTILPPYTAENEMDWYKGTADAILQNASFIRAFNPERILILSGDHVYCMDYRKMIEYHKEIGADLTIAVIEVPKKEASRFGIIEVEKDGRVVGFEEKPEKPKGNLGSLGIYVFNTKILMRRLFEDANMSTSHDFGKDIITRMVTIDRVYVYKFEGYWRDVGTLQSYWEANMDLLDEKSGLNIFNWNLRTNPNDRELGDRLPAYISSRARVRRSMISVGCNIEGKVENSILSPGVIVEEGAVVKDSVIMHDTVIKSGAFVDHAIIDKDVVIESGAEVGVGKATVNKLYPNLLSNELVVIGKAALIPQNYKIGKTSIIFPNVSCDDYNSTVIEPGETIFHVTNG